MYQTDYSKLEYVQLVIKYVVMRSGHNHVEMSKIITELHFQNLNCMNFQRLENRRAISKLCKMSLCGIDEQLAELSKKEKMHAQRAA